MDKQREAVAEQLRKQELQAETEDLMSLYAVSEQGETEAGKLTREEGVRFINNVLYFFYSCPWRWKSFTKDIDYESDDGQVIKLRLTFEPHKELKLEKI